MVHMASALQSVADAEKLLKLLMYKIRRRIVLNQKNEASTRYRAWAQWVIFRKTTVARGYCPRNLFDIERLRRDLTT